MSLGIVLVLTLLIFAALLLSETPIGLALALSGALGILLMDGGGNAAGVLRSTPFSSSSSYALFAIPMFVLLGSFVDNAGIAARIYSAAGVLVRRLPGGVAATAVIATAIFSGVSGSSAADTATMGRISVGEMRKHGYRIDYAASVVAAAGAFASLIPPSIAMIVYGIVAQVSIGAMLLAGIVPGVVSGIALIGFLVLRARSGYGMTQEMPVYPGVLKGAEEAETNHRGEVVQGSQVETITTREKWAGILYAAILFAIVAGGIYSGIFTATEAGAVGAFAALLLTVLAWRSRRYSVSAVITASLRETAEITSMIFLLLLGGAVFTYFIVSTRVPDTIARWVTGLPVPALLIIAIFLVVLIPLGMFLDGLSIMLLTVPIMAPVVHSLGYDGIWFGVLVMKAIEIGLITPPVGINCFIMAGMFEDLRLEDIFRRITPFVALDLGVTALLFAVPGIVTWLPRAAGF